MARLLSVNVGVPRDIAWKGRTVHTGIWKDPVQGRCPVGRLNLLDGFRAQRASAIPLVGGTAVDIGVHGHHAPTLTQSRALLRHSSSKRAESSITAFGERTWSIAEFNTSSTDGISLNPMLANRLPKGGCVDSESCACFRLPAIAASANRCGARMAAN